MSRDRQIMGTYLHGIFEAPEGCRALLEWAGLEGAEQLDYAAVREKGIDRLADAIAASLDMSRLDALRPEFGGH